LETKMHAGWTNLYFKEVIVGPSSWYEREVMTDRIWEESERAT
jgi:hypothetical protein